MVTQAGLLEQIKRTYTRRGREASGFFPVEGLRLCERALRAGVKLAFVVVTERFVQDKSSRSQQLWRELESAEIPIHTIPNIHQLTQGRGWGDIIALAPLPSCDTNANFQSRLVLDNIIDPGNVGALLRTAHGLGVRDVVALGQTDPFHPRAVRTSMGSVFRLNVVFGGERGVGTGKRVGMVASGGVPLDRFDFGSDKVELWVGNEYEGLSAETQSQLDHLITIPMPADIDSLSVNAATAIVLYEIGRHKNLNKSPNPPIP